MATSFWSSFSSWMTKSTSIMGAAVATPAFAGLMTGQLSWQQALLPLIGAAVAVAIPQTSAPPHPDAPLPMVIMAPGNVQPQPTPPVK